MPELRPFRGVRYSSAGELTDLVCPPYDVISKDEQARLYARHPHNAVHLEQARSLGGASGSKYASAKDSFSDWLESGVLVRDREPALYAYRQDFRIKGRERRVTGVIGALKLEPYGKGSGILPHERTMPGPIADRLALLRASPINVSPIYTIYRGGGSLDDLYASLDRHPADARFRDEHGTTHSLWTLQAPGDVKRIAECIGDCPLVIADGHHRYETALAYHREQTSPGAHEAVMTFCVDADTAALQILPYHRVVRAQISSAELRARLSEKLSVAGLEGLSAEEALARAGRGPSFVFVLPKESLLVEAESAGSGPQDLDVVALHDEILPAVLPEGLETLRFTTAESEVMRLVRAGWTAGVLLRPLRAVDVVDVARSGERMPQKASYFWPKAATGLIFRPLH